MSRKCKKFGQSTASQKRLRNTVLFYLVSNSFMALEYHFTLQIFQFETNLVLKFVKELRKASLTSVKFLDDNDFF
jgi:hypothetical protein